MLAVEKGSIEMIKAMFGHKSSLPFSEVLIAHLLGFVNIRID